MSDDEAKALLGQLSAYYGEPVMPLHRFCDAITTWFRSIEANCREPDLIRNPEHPEYQHGADYHMLLRRIEVDITKSDLLYRLLYNGQQLRTKMCPDHKGHWDGPSSVGLETCPHGCDGTGWLRDS